LFFLVVAWMLGGYVGATTLGAVLGGVRSPGLRQAALGLAGTLIARSKQGAAGWNRAPAPGDNAMPMPDRPATINTIRAGTAHRAAAGPGPADHAHDAINSPVSRLASARRLARQRCHDIPPPRDSPAEDGVTGQPPGGKPAISRRTLDLSGSPSVGTVAVSGLSG